MATIIPFVRKSTKKESDVVKIRYRVLDGRGVDAFFVSETKVNFENWDTKRHCLKARVIISPVQRLAIAESIMLHTQHLQTALSNLRRNGVKITSNSLNNEMYYLLNPDVKIALETRNFFDYFDDFRNHKKVGNTRMAFYKVLRGMFERFEMYRRVFDKNFYLDIKTFSLDTASQFAKFLENEHKISEDYRELYRNKVIKPRGTNTICCKIKGAITFFNYLVRYGKLDRSPFVGFEYAKEAYGTPFYLTIDERNMLYRYNLSDNPELERQRDIFVFHCVIGCRVGDLLRLTKHNVINGAVEYIAGKTKDGNPKTIRVPLNKIGLEILEKYCDYEGDKLLPFISEQKYNVAIKKALKTAEINRIVTIMDSQTRLDKQVPIYEVASSHLARRTLYANVYKKFKDPALAGSLTGHSPTSKAALRYRDIDEDMKIELVRSLE